ncbi:hypothetical protein G5I_01648 [Acromyrmex echinatior]|uniref:Uncharacterized protein n=1 Tax=Acromyrmex echinatior TaxID=103372 RepID=F4W869_ACREC|nr:hypothetical protein G5I_01648 [Acromyrmex echinatior]
MRLSNTELPGNMGAGSWLELDGLKTLNTETCRTTAAADRPLDTAVIYTGTIYTRMVYTPADYTAADCMERDKATDRDVEGHYEILRTLHRLFYTEIYRGSVPSWSSRSLTLRSFLTVTSCDSTRLQPCQSLTLCLVIIAVCRATPFQQSPVSSSTSAFSNAVLSVK